MAARAAITYVGGTKARPFGVLHIQCRVKPGVDKRREGVASVLSDAVELNVSAPPREGEANKAVIKLLSDVLKIPKTDMRIVHGLKSRDKTVEISPAAFGGSVEERNQEWWQALIQGRLASEHE
ncbi:hypothetical protein BX600DRAFT_265243 [Xylariales sp. PMI_506]|nr:hypothetical protein BX600DRAFT_265243 [Xylariales sp. PMI_506]